MGLVSFRRAAWLGALVAGMVLALAVPSIALAANTATFKSPVPAVGSLITNSQPTISLIGYDRYGVRASGISMWVGGVRVTPAFAYNNLGNKSFRLSYSVPAALSAGAHRVTVKVHDLRSMNSTYSWLFTTVAPAPVPFAHAAPNVSCTAAGCHHNLDVASIHLAKTCAPCHAPGVVPTTNCTAAACHGTNPPANHAVHLPILSSGTPACTQATCHGSAALTIHSTCAVCHGSASATVVAAIAAGGATCESCHGVGFYTTSHGTGNASHVVGAGSCFVATCHGTDVTAMHTKDFRGTGATPPGCAACHAAGKTPSTNCTTCHTDLITPHDYAAAHARVQPLMATNSTACVACHGSDLKKVLPVPTSVPAPTVFTEHDGCSCHAYAEARGKTTCEGCHNGAHAPHSFTNGVSRGEGYVAASGHNTPNLGTVGGFSMFDGSQGVLLKDTEEDTVTTKWDLPTKNVFWASTDASAPATAIKGLTWSSVVTCQDCHTGLRAAGPHGAAEDWGIDSNYPYPFKYAILGGPAGARSFTDPALNYRAGGGVTAATPATLSAGIPASASGIKARIASNLSTSTNAPVQIKSTALADLMITNYNNYPDGRGAEYIADATSGQYAVICAKCHDLYNGSVPTTSAVDNGWGNAGPDAYEGMHGAHAGGTARNGNDLGRIDGRSDCAACHVAIPHGWKQPRLLVNGYTGTYKLGGSWDGVNKVVVGGTDITSTADPFPYYQGRGMPLAAGIGVMAPAPAVSPGNGPNDAKDDHAFNAYGKPVWEEAACISCSGSTTGVGWAGLEHRGITTEPAKLQDK